MTAPAARKIRRGSTLIVPHDDGDWDLETMEKVLLSKVEDGIVCDLVEVQEGNLRNPAAIAHFGHLPVKLYESPVVTRVFKAALDQKLPGTQVKYNDVISAIMQHSSDSFCFVHGGQVRDMLMGKVSKDVDITYSCTAKEVALLCVEKGWPTNYKAIGVDGEPNYVMIGEEQGGLYMEGFSLDFSITAPCFKQDFRRNMLIYDLTNNVIIDKTGYGVQDLKNNELRFSCAPCKDLWEDWARAESTPGEKALRYVKFVMRAELRSNPLTIDAEESAFVAVLLQRALRDNQASLKHFWFGYLLGECLSTQEGLHALYTWVCNQKIPSWWEEWLPFVRAAVGDASWLVPLMPKTSSGLDRVKQEFAASKGFIQATELKYVLHGLMGCTDEDFEKLVVGLSVNESGKLAVDEFLERMFRA